MQPAKNPSLNDLLSWATKNASAINKATEAEDAKGPAEPKEPIDPKWVDIILGKKDAQRMKDAVTIIHDESKSLEEREAAFDELELLIEHIDNANDLTPLKLWPKIISVLDFKEPSLRLYAAWVIGTALQNNEEAQKVFCNNDYASNLLSVLKVEVDKDVKSKLLYALSAFLRGNKVGRGQITELNGWPFLFELVQAEDMNLKRKILNLLNALVVEDPLFCKLLIQYNVIESMINSLRSFNEDEHFSTMIMTITFESLKMEPNCVSEESKSLLKEHFCSMKENYLDFMPDVASIQ